MVGQSAISGWKLHFHAPNVAIVFEKSRSYERHRCHYCINLLQESGGSGVLSNVSIFDLPEEIIHHVVTFLSLQGKSCWLAMSRINVS